MRRLPDLNVNKIFDPIRSRLSARAPAHAIDQAARLAAVALILSPGRGGIEVFLIKRAEDPRDHWSGHIALPGGRRDPKDKDLLATAVRETSEETGIILENSEVLGELDDLRPRNRGLPRYIIRPFVFGIPRKPSIRPNPEVADSFWVPLDRLRDSSGMAFVPQRKMRVPSFRANGHVVWGITYRILTPFLNL